MHPSCLLADMPEFGRVYDCGDCGNIHVAIGAVNLTFTPAGFMQLVAMINTSAANFEIWMQDRGHYAEEPCQQWEPRNGDAEGESRV